MSATLLRHTIGKTGASSTFAEHLRKRRSYDDGTMRACVGFDLVDMPQQPPWSVLLRTLQSTSFRTR